MRVDIFDLSVRNSFVNAGKADLRHHGKVSLFPSTIQMALTVHHIVSTRQMRRELSAELSQTSTTQFLSAKMDSRSAVPSIAEESNCNKPAAKSS